MQSTSDNQKIHVRVLFFGAARDLVGLEELDLSLTPPADPVFITLTTQRSYLLGLQETHIFSPAVVNVATMGFSRAWGTQVQAPAVPIPANLVFLTGTNPGAITIGGAANTVVAAALAQPTGNSPNRDTRNHFTWADDVRFTRGSHSWSAGLWIQQVQQRSKPPQPDE